MPDDFAALERAIQIQAAAIREQAQAEMERAEAERKSAALAQEAVDLEKTRLALKEQLLKRINELLDRLDQDAKSRKETQETLASIEQKMNLLLELNRVTIPRLLGDADSPNELDRLMELARLISQAGGNMVLQAARDVSVGGDVIGRTKKGVNDDSVH